MIQKNKSFSPEFSKKFNSQPWIKLAPGGAPYFITEEGNSWTPIGQNDAINWPDLNNLFKRKDLTQVDNHLKWLKDHGVTVMRLMLEYSQDNYRYLERPVGRFQPDMVKLWDDLFYLCEKHGLRVLLTPFDTFWMWLRWKHHPYNKKNGGPCSKRGEFISSHETTEALKNRFTFVIERWGGSGTIFAWDLWNEIHPELCGGRIENIIPFIDEISNHVRDLELKLYGKSHLQTVSVFGPQLEKNPELADAIFRHPYLDFATSHFYDATTINNPKDTVNSAIMVGKLVREALEHIKDDRPFLDSEHGPIHAFKNRKRTLNEAFDNEYFKHIQWAHMASGGAGGGMRWPNRHPHVLTHGMRQEQLKLSSFQKLIDWKNFKRKNLNQEVKISNPAFAVFCCADDQQAVLYLLRRDKIRRKMISAEASPEEVKVLIPGLNPGIYSMREFDTLTGTIKNKHTINHQSSEKLLVKISGITSDIAVAIKLDASERGK